MSELVARKVVFLQTSLASEVSHSGHNLLEHLIGTASLLTNWGCDQPTVDGGLFHSVYGTETFHSSLIPVDQRKVIRGVIGKRAEHLAYLFGVMVKESLDANLDRRCHYALVSRLDGASITIVEKDFEALCHISLANWLEQRDRRADVSRDYRTISFGKMVRLLRPGAVLAFRSAYGLR
jgi:hypothetical protein